jgi:hypothetical protein
MDPAGFASDLYDVASWGKGYFSVGDNGHIRVTRKRIRPLHRPEELVDTLVLRGINLPILIRFADILKHRLGELHSAFQTAIAEHHYQGGYCCVYPIKVNQQRQVVEEVLEFGKPFQFGLEAGSKPELMAVMAWPTTRRRSSATASRTTNTSRWPCWRRRSAARSSRWSKSIPSCTDSEVQPSAWRAAAIGLRVKLASRGSGRWKSSGGYRSKFGLSVTEAMRALQELKDAGHGRLPQPAALPPGQPDHQHPQIKGAVNEAVRVYVDLARAGAGLKYLDVGGGLGIDYDGSQTDFESSVNYTLQEYANDVVYHVQNVCDEGRRAASHHHHRERPRHRRLSQRAGVQRSGRGRHGRERCAAEPRRTPNSRSSTCRRPIARNRQEPAGKLSRRAAGARFRRSTCSAWAICRSNSAASPRTCIGRFARKIQKQRGSSTTSRRAGRHRRHALGYLFLQFLAVPEHAR